MMPNPDAIPADLKLAWEAREAGGSHEELFAASSRALLADAASLGPESQSPTTELEQRRRDQRTQHKLLLIWDQLVFWVRQGDAQMWQAWLAKGKELQGEDAMERIKTWADAHQRGDCARDPKGGHPWQCMRCKWG